MQLKQLLETNNHLLVKLLPLVVLLNSIVFNSCNRTTITFSEHIAPIIHTNCTPCHRASGGAPFNLIYYKDVAKRAKMIHHVTSIRYMPPWPADPQYSRFAGERILTENEINLIKDWYQQGALAGDTSLIVLPPILKNGSRLGKPDYQIEVPTIYIQGNNKDKFLVVKIPFELPFDTFIRAVEFVPGIPWLAHHVNGHLLLYDSDAKKNVFDGSRIANHESDSFGLEFDLLRLKNDNGTLPLRIHSAVNYLPGVSAQKYPEGIGGFRTKQKGAFVANDIHYGPSAKDTFDKSYINIFFGEKAPKRQLYETMMGTNGVSDIVPPLLIPAGKVMTFTSRLDVPEDISILTVNPHLHLLGKSFVAFAVKPNGDTIRLIRINKWDFRWQYFYTFKTMVKIPKGSVIVVEATFDNTAQNPNNPNKPPKPVGERIDRGGASMRTTDEMLQFIITYTPYQPGDEKISLEIDEKN